MSEHGPDLCIPPPIPSRSGPFLPKEREPIRTGPASVPPEILEPVRRQGRVHRGARNRPVAKPSLKAKPLGRPRQSGSPCHRVLASGSVYLRSLNAIEDRNGWRRTCDIGFSVRNIMPQSDYGHGLGDFDRNRRALHGQRRESIVKPQVDVITPDGRRGDELSDVGGGGSRR